MASKLKKPSWHSQTLSLPAPTKSSRATPTTPTFPRNSIGNLSAGVSVLEDKRRSAYETLAVSADLLDTTRRQSRRSMLENLGSTADLLDSTRRNISKGIRKGAEKVKTLSLNREKDYPSDDESFFCVGEGKPDEDKEKREEKDEDVVVVPEPKWPPRRSSLGWVIIGMLARKGELRDSVIQECEKERYEKPLPSLPEGDGTSDITYRHSTQ